MRRCSLEHSIRWFFVSRNKLRERCFSARPPVANRFWIRLEPFWYSNASNALLDPIHASGNPAADCDRQLRSEQLNVKFEKKATTDANTSWCALPAACISSASLALLHWKTLTRMFWTFSFETVMEIMICRNLRASAKRFQISVFEKRAVGQLGEALH